MRSSVSTRATGKAKPEVDLFVSANMDTVSQVKALVDTSSNTFSIVNSPEGNPMLIPALATASLYRPSLASNRPPKSKVDDLGQSELFTAFAEDAVVQGTQEDMHPAPLHGSLPSGFTEVHPAYRLSGQA